MHTRMLVRVALALALAFSTGACVDDLGPTNPAVDVINAAGGGDGGAPATVRMLSRNLYLGGDIDHVLFDPVSGPDIAWAEIQYTNFVERAPHLAAEILDRMPHLVGLQEVTRFVLRDPGTMSPVLTLDWLDILMNWLGPAGYVVVERGAHFHTYIPMGGFIVEYLDGDAIIARISKVHVHASGKQVFSLANQVNLGDYVPGLGYNLRGFQWADVSVDRSRFLFVNAHLEVQHWADIQEGQTAELLAFVNQKRMPTFMVGDFNSAANPNAPARAKTASYRMILDAGFDDLWLRGRGRFTNAGPTCCQASDLSNATSELDERLDILFARNTPNMKGYAGGADLHLFGHEPSDRFQTSHGYYLWPSDHAGLFGELWLPPGLMR
jgi:endonuclease/exonuclease/phosphatase family metal-dependent hydrolase